MCRRLRATTAGFYLAALIFTLWPARGEDLVTCGWDEVVALRIEGSNVTALWKWSAANSNLPEWCKPLFATTDECKPSRDGTVLITSSGGTSLNGAVALVEPRTSNVLFYASAPNAHSATLLPADRIAVAMSYHTNGNRVAIFNLRMSNVELFSVPLTGAHGVVWDNPRQTLWALGDSFLHEYRLQDWDSNPQLLLVSRVGLPDGGGHDMYPLPNSLDLAVTTASHCWRFNRETRKFTKHALLGDTANVKSMSMHPTTGRLVYVQSDGPWWSEWLRMLEPETTLRFPGAHLYKARWLYLPLISIANTRTNTTAVSWPSALIGFSILQSDTLDGANWVPLTEAPQEKDEDSFILSNPQASQRFYRFVEWPQPVESQAEGGGLKQALLR